MHATLTLSLPDHKPTSSAGSKIQSGQYLIDNPGTLFCPWESALPDQGSPGACGQPGSSSHLPADGFGEDLVAVTEDFQGLLAEVGTQAEGLRGLSRGLCDQLLAGLVRVLQEEPALQTLEEAVSGPAGVGAGGGCTRAIGLTAPPCVHSWNRACSVGGWHPWKVRWALSSSAWCIPPEH